MCQWITAMSDLVVFSSIFLNGFNYEVHYPSKLVLIYNGMCVLQLCVLAETWKCIFRMSRREACSKSINPERMDWFPWRFMQQVSYNCEVDLELISEGGWICKRLLIIYFFLKLTAGVVCNQLEFMRWESICQNLHCWNAKRNLRWDQNRAVWIMGVAATFSRCPASNQSSKNN